MTEDEINLLNSRPRDLSEQDQRKRNAIRKRQARAKRKHVEGDLTLQQKKAKNQKQKDYRKANSEKLNAQQQEYRKVNARSLNAQRRE